MTVYLNLVTRVNKKSKGKGREPCKIHHVGNVIGGEGLITRGQTNEMAHALLTGFFSYSFKQFLAIRTGMDSTTILPGSIAKHDSQIGNYEHATSTDKHILSVVKLTFVPRLVCMHGREPGNEAR